MGPPLTELQHIEVIAEDMLAKEPFRWAAVRTKRTLREKRGVLPYAHAHGAVFVTCNRDDFLALRPEGEHPGIVILIRRRTRQAEIAGFQTAGRGLVLGFGVNSKTQRR